MRSCINQCECQDIILNEIDQKPVWFVMALMKPGIFAFEHMVFILLVKRISLTQLIHNCIEKVKIETTFFH